MSVAEQVDHIMVEALLSSALPLSKLVEALKELSSYFHLECTSEGIRLQAIDSSRVALTIIQLPASSFATFRCDGPMILGLSFEEFARVLQSAESDESLMLRVDEPSRRLHLVFQGKDLDRTSEFSLNLQVLDYEHLEIPEFDYPVVMTLQSVQFNRICRDLSQLSDSLSIDVTQHRVQFWAKGNTGEGSVTLLNREQGGNQAWLNVVEALSSTYMMKLFTLFNKSASLSKEVRLSLAESQPLFLKCLIELGDIRFYLSPQV